MRDDLTKPEPLILSQDRRNVIIIGVATTDAERRRSVKNSDQNVKIVSHVRRLCHVILLLLLLWRLLGSESLVGHVQVEGGALNNDWRDLLVTEMV